MRKGQHLGHMANLIKEVVSMSIRICRDFSKFVSILALCVTSFCPGPTSQNFVFLFYFHSVSSFLGFLLAKALVSGSGSNIPLIQDIEPSNSRA